MKPNKKVLESLDEAGKKAYLADLERLGQLERAYKYEKSCLRYLPKSRKSAVRMPILNPNDDIDYEEK